MVLTFSQLSWSTVTVLAERELNSEATMEIDTFRDMPTNAAKMDDSPMEIDAPDMSNSGSPLITAHSSVF